MQACASGETSERCKEESCLDELSTHRNYRRLIQIDPLIKGNGVAVAASLPIARDCLCQVCAKKVHTPYTEEWNEAAGNVFPQFIG